MKHSEKWMMAMIVTAVFCMGVFGALADGGRTVAPMENIIDVENLPDGVYPVSFERDAVQADESGITLNGVHVYTRDWYDIVDVNMLEVGDTIIVEGAPVEVLTLERDEYGVCVNEDQNARAFYLVNPEDSNGYIVQGMNDLSTYTEQGVAALKVADGATFTDAWDIEKGPVTVEYDDIAQALETTENDAFVPDNTTLRVESGAVVEINREYMP